MKLREGNEWIDKRDERNERVGEVRFEKYREYNYEK